MASTWGDRLGSTGRRNLGTGMQIAPENIPVSKIVHYGSFRNGLMLADRPADVPEGYFAKALDVESTRNDGIKRATPIVLTEDTKHWLDNLFVHSTLDFQSELIAVVPPHPFDLPESAFSWFGVKQGSVFEWTNVGDDFADPSGHWVYTNYGDTLIFSNGRKSYSRTANGTPPYKVVPGMPGAVSLFVAFGRLFALGTLDAGGEYNVLALEWNGTLDFDDWTGPDAGAELLISDTAGSDKAIAGRMMSYDTVAILCRRSVWIGLRTGIAGRPLEPQVRLSGVGCVSEASARTTESGVTFLSDEGVRHFDGQKAEIISGPINSHLLPLVYEELDSYRATWDGGRRRYILCTPCATYVYQFPTSEFPQGAWFKKTIALTNIISFPSQFDDPTWDDFLDRTWNDLGNETWLDYATPEADSSPQVVYVSGMIYGSEDPQGDGYFGLPMSGVVEPRPTEGLSADDNSHELHEVKTYLVEYRGAGTLQILVRNEDGGYQIGTEATLPYAIKTRTVRLDVSYSIRAVGIALRFLDSTLEVLSLKQTVQNSGPALADMVTEDDELFDETSDEVYSELDPLVLWRT